MKMKNLFGVLGLVVFLGLSSVAWGAICPTTPNTNSDCGYLLTIGQGGSITGALVLVGGNPANPYDGSDDSLVGVINNSGGVYNGTIHLTGSGNGGGIFQFDGDGICTYVNAPYCANAQYGYEGPLNTFANIGPGGTAGDVVFTGLAAGATTYFSLEGSPASIGNITGTPEPGTMLLLGSGLLGAVGAIRRKINL